MNGFDTFYEMLNVMAGRVSVPEPRKCATAKELSDWFVQAAIAAGQIARSGRAKP